MLDKWAILFQFTKNTSDGTGVNVFTFIWDNNAGIWPLRAPTKHIRELAMIWTHNPPNAEIATIIGITHAPYDNNLFPKVCLRTQKIVL